MGVEAVKVETHEEQDAAEKALRESWLATRQSGVGSSEAAAVLGKSSYSTPLKVYASKLGLLEEKDLAEEFEYVYWGSQLEAPIVRRYARETGRRIVTRSPYTISRHPDVPHAFASLDAVDEADGVNGVVECKTINGFMFGEWRDTGEAPIGYQIQLQHALWCTGFKRGAFAVLVDGRSFFWQDVKRDDVFINDVLAPAVAEFWRMVQAKEAPAATGSDEDKRVLFQLHPDDSGREVELGEEYIADHKIIQESKESMKTLKELSEASENRLREAMKDATTARLPGEIVYTLKTQERKSFVMPASKYRVLRYVEPPKEKKKGKGK